jgi:hypothetical protein
MLFKLDNVTNLTSARWAAAEGFDILTFNFDKTSKHYIQPMKAIDICKWISGVKFIGKFDNSEYSKILDIYHLLALDAVEIDLESANYIAENEGIPIVLSLPSIDFEKALAFEKYYSHLMALSFQSNLKVPENYPIERSFFPSNYPLELLNKTPFGINFDSAIETETGIANFEELDLYKQKWHKK